MVCFSNEKDVCTDIAWLPGHVPCVCTGTQWVTSRVTPQTLPRNPSPTPSRFFTSQWPELCHLGLPPQRQAEKAISISSPWGGSQKKTWGEGSWKASMRQAEWFPGQLTVSMPGGGPRSPDCHVLPFRENDKKKKKRAWTLAPEHWAPSWNGHLLAVTVGELSFNLFELNFLICRWGIKLPPPKCGGKWEDGWPKSLVNC